MGFLIPIVGRLPQRWLKAVSRLQWKHPGLKRLFEMASDCLRDQDSAIQQGVGQGLRFNAGGSFAGQVLGTTEPLVQQAFSALLRPGMTVFDIGANVGAWTA